MALAPLIFFPLFFLVGLALFGFWLWALVDCLKSEFEGQNKIVWVLVIIFTHFIGAIIYFAVGRERKLPPAGPRIP